MLCSSQTEKRRTLAKKHIDNNMFLDYIISHFPKQISNEIVLGINGPPLHVWIISWVKMWRGTTLPMWSNNTAGIFRKKNSTDGGTEEKHTLKGAEEGVTTLDSLSHASTLTDVLSPRPAWNVPKTSLCLQWRDCTVLCVWACACESTCLINHWNQPHQSLTNRQHSRLVPECRIWAKWLN